jgi:hypothetical protein
MSEGLPNDLETLWEHLLSRQPEKITAAFSNLSAAEQQTVFSHLRRMAEEPGWHPEQRASARTALDVINPPAAPCP